MDDFSLVINAGSSSLKFAVYRRPGSEEWRLESRGQIEGIGTSPQLSLKQADGRKLIEEPAPEVKNGRDALDALARRLRSLYGGSRVLGVGHRVVHGGAKYTGPVVITPEVLADLHRLTPLAPLHQPHNLEAIEAVSKLLPDVPQVACFDTSFHRSMSSVAQLVPLPREIRERGVQRYGFHGLSYEYIASMLPQVAPEIANGRVIVAHLGSGASMCAMKHRKSIDTTFSFTALDGLCMGTRPGAIDPGVILYLFQNLGLSAKEVETILYMKSGLLGISGISNDMRDLLASHDSAAQLAVDYFVFGGIDGLVFTAGIGENSAEIRRRICGASAWLGIELDADANERRGPRISTGTSRVSVWVIPTDEELMIARHTGLLLGLTTAHNRKHKPSQTQGAAYSH